MFNDAVLAEYVRDGFVESEHRGFLAMLNSDGSLLKSLGDIDTQIFPRSTVTVSYTHLTLPTKRIV